jgi:hypothetical protein
VVSSAPYPATTHHIEGGHPRPRRLRGEFGPAAPPWAGPPWAASRSSGATADHSQPRATRAAPLVGPLEFRYESFTVNGADPQLLTVYHAEPGSPTERSLALLSSLTAKEHADAAPQ